MISRSGSPLGFDIDNVQVQIGSGGSGERKTCLVVSGFHLSGLGQPVHLGLSKSVGCNPDKCVDLT